MRVVASGSHWNNAYFMCHFLASKRSLITLSFFHRKHTSCFVQLLDRLQTKTFLPLRIHQPKSTKLGACAAQTNQTQVCAGLCVKIFHYFITKARVELKQPARPWTLFTWSSAGGWYLLPFNRASLHSLTAKLARLKWILKHQGQ